MRTRRNWNRGAEVLLTACIAAFVTHLFHLTKEYAHPHNIYFTSNTNHLYRQNDLHPLLFRGNSAVLHRFRNISDAYNAINSTISPYSRRSTLNETETSLSDLLSNLLSKNCILVAIIRIKSQQSSPGPLASFFATSYAHEFCALALTFSNMPPAVQRSWRVLHSASSGRLRYVTGVSVNQAYIIALQARPAIIFDAFDDINFHGHGLAFRSLVTSLLSKEARNIPIAQSSLFSNNQLILNPHKWFDPVSVNTLQKVSPSWPRGFPHRQVPLYRQQQNVSITFREDYAGTESISARDIVVVTALVDGLPDVDENFQLLTNNLPMVFRANHRGTIGIPSDKYIPFGSDSTLWLTASNISKYLLFTPSIPQGDLLRGFIAQAILNRIGFRTAITKPFSHREIRGKSSASASHNNDGRLASWIAEQVAPVVRFIVDKSQTECIDFIIANVYEQLYEMGVVELNDIVDLQKFFQAVGQIGDTTGNVDTELSCISEQSDEEQHQVSMKHVPLHENIPVDLPIPVDEPRIAICVSGQIRTMTLSPRSSDHPKSWHLMQSTYNPPNETVAASIQRHVLSKFPHADVFMPVFRQQHDSDENIQLHDTSVCEPLRPSNGNLHCTIHLEEAMKDDVQLVKNDTLWAEFEIVKAFAKYNASYLGLLSAKKFLWQLRGLYECGQMIEAKQIHYDWIIRLRPDTFFWGFPELWELARDSKVGNTDLDTIWHAAGGMRCCCGMEDVFAIGTEAPMLKYLSRLTELQTTEWGWKAISGNGNKRGWIAEDYVKAFLKKSGIQLRSHLGIEACVVKPLSRKPFDIEETLKTMNLLSSGSI